MLQVNCGAANACQPHEVKERKALDYFLPLCIATPLSIMMSNRSVRSTVTFGRRLLSSIGDSGIEDRGKITISSCR
jgi:hypothetical protein